MTKAVFISHDNRDKGVIKPYLHALHAEGFTLFIDRPSEVGLDPTDERIQSIQMREGHQSAIIRELTEAGVVLVFWTMNSATKAQKTDVLSEEIISARDRLRAVLIADSEAKARKIEGEIPKLLRERQHLKLIGVDTAGLADNADFRSLVAQLREALAGAPTPEQALDRKVLAMLVDRGGPIERFKDAGVAALEHVASGAGDLRSHGVVTIGQSEDIPELLHERFRHFDGLECFERLSAGLGEALGQPVWFANKQWNHYNMKSLEDDKVQPSDFTLFMSKKLALLNHTRPLRGRGYQYAIVPTVSVREENIGDDAAGNIAAWISAWDEELAEPPEVPVLPLLYITHSKSQGGGWRSWFPFSATKRLARAVKDAVDEVKPRHLTVTTVKGLDKIDWEDTRSWLRTYVPMGGRLYSEADGLLRDLFPKKQRSPGLCMEDLYSELTSSSSFGGTAT